MCWFSGPPTKSVFVTVNEQCSAQHLADLVLSNQLAISEVDPECRTEVEKLVIDHLASESRVISKEFRKRIEAMWTIPPEEWRKRCKG